mgnify:CR=1 FL=1
MEKLGQIKILKERKVAMVELDLDMDDQTIDKLAHAGFNMIKYDRQELAAYAFRKALEAYANKDKECTLRLSKRSSRR